MAVHNVNALGIFFKLSYSSEKNNLREFSGLHRYCFFVFKQSGKIQVDQEKADKLTVKPRRKFKIQSFVDKHELGAAVAGNFFMAEYDDYVRISRAQIKDLD